MAEDINIKIENDLQGEKVLSIEKGGYTYPLNSRIDAEGVSELYAKRYGNEKFFNTIILFGFSDGRIIRNFLKNMSEGGGVIVFEPSEEIFETAKKEFAVDDILIDKRISIIYGEDNLLVSYVALITAIPVSMLDCLQYAILPNYDVIYKGLCNKWQNLTFNELHNNIINRNTLISSSNKLVNYFINNLPVLIKNSDIALLIENFRKYDISDIPAVIVGAGPSLDKNIKYLKGMENKIFIIATDASIRTLVKFGVKCHIMINVDQNIQSEFFRDKSMEEAGLVIMANGNSDIFTVHSTNNFIYYSYFDDVVTGIFGKTFDHKLISFDTGGSVSCDAYSLAKALGFKKIIFIGQDLAYTGGKLHTETFNAAHGTTDEKYREGRLIVKVPDWDGNELETDYQMYAYLKWFNKKFELDKKYGIDVYDATEGGAKKEYATRITLREALNLLVGREFDFYYIIHHTRKTFTRKQYGNALKKIERIPCRLRRLRSELYIKKEHFLKLSKEYEEKSNNPDYIRYLIKDIQKTMHYSSEAALVSLIYLENGDADNALDNVSFDEDIPFSKVLKTYSDYYSRYYNSCNSLITRIENKYKDR